jgi:hypothetical protein
MHWTVNASSYSSRFAYASKFAMPVYRELQSEKYLSDHHRNLEEQKRQAANARRARSAFHSAIAFLFFSSVVCAVLTASHWLPEIRQMADRLNFGSWFF